MFELGRIKRVRKLDLIKRVRKNVAAVPRYFLFLRLAFSLFLRLAFSLFLRLAFSLFLRLAFSEEVSENAFASSCKGRKSYRYFKIKRPRLSFGELVGAWSVNMWERKVNHSLS
jgi:hypothetical protein